MYPGGDPLTPPKSLFLLTLAAFGGTSVLAFVLKGYSGNGGLVDTRNLAYFLRDFLIFSRKKQNQGFGNSV